MNTNSYSLYNLKKHDKSEAVCFCVLKVYLKKINFIFLYFKLIFFLVFLNHFDVLMSKIFSVLQKTSDSPAISCHFPLRTKHTCRYIAPLYLEHGRHVLASLNKVTKICECSSGKLQAC